MGVVKPLVYDNLALQYLFAMTLMDAKTTILEIHQIRAEEAWIRLQRAASLPDEDIREKTRSSKSLITPQKHTRKFVTPMEST